jgi:hypothetical protein
MKKLVKGEDIIRYAKVQTVKRWGHRNGMGDMKLVKKVTDWKPVE